MSEDAAGRFRLNRMLPRDPREPHRTASSLELFFDLVFVVAVSTASAQLHHALSAGHPEGLVTYLLVFFGIWWAWMNFTWFATSFGTDDWLYRVLTFVQMAGVLVLAAGIAPAFDDGDFRLVVLAYIVMRVAMIAQWLRASRSAGAMRRATRLYPIGIGTAQVLWIGFLFVPEQWRIGVFILLALVEIAVPVVAELRGQTPWHPHHITERYSLFTLIVLGESLLASANAVIGAIKEVDTLGPLISIAALTLVATASMWWIYFWPPHHLAITSLGRSLRYGYAHYVIFAAAAAFSAGIEVEIDRMVGASEVDALAASFTVTVPIAIFLLSVWFVAIREAADRVVNTVVPAGALLVLLDPVLPVPVTLTAGILVLIVVTLVLRPPVVRPAVSAF